MLQFFNQQIVGCAAQFFRVDTFLLIVFCNYFHGNENLMSMYGINGATMLIFLMHKILWQMKTYRS